MKNTVIKVENLSKQYRLGQVGTGTISHDVNRWWHKIRGQEDPYLKIGEFNDRTVKGESDYVWALKDINFEVQQGEVLGIIGRNGAGKSTLLKILSRTTAPSTGSVKIKGRVASLLEVGTGFHPELSGRDNIFLNGAILGMTRSEIQSKFDEIVDFAGVERYIDTPVKRYSSGMYVRLAFAVAAHLEPEILIVDEVLAVGDAEFQKKCLGKIKDVSKNQGRTVLFVSHFMDAIKQLASNTIILKNGYLFKVGETGGIISAYLNDQVKQKEIYHFQAQNDKPFFESIKIETSINGGVQIFGEKLDIDIVISLPIKTEALEVSYQIFNESDETPIVYNWFSSTEQMKGIKSEIGKFLLKIEIPNLRIYKGKYYFKFHLSDPRGKVVYESIDYYSPFEVIMGDIYNEWGFNRDVCRYIETCNIKVLKISSQ